MITIWAEVEIEDLDKFLKVFSTKGLEMRKLHGSISSSVYKIENEDQRILIVFEWTSKEAFLGFTNDQTVKETMKSSGTTRPPVFKFIEKADEFEG